MDLAAGSADGSGHGPGRTVAGHRAHYVDLRNRPLGATALTVAAIGVGVDRGLLPHSLAYALDVGPSYGLVALAAVLATRLPARRTRRAAIAALLFGLATAVIIGGDFTDAGHLIAALIGLALSRIVTGTARVHANPGSPMAERTSGLPSVPAGRKSSGPRLLRCGYARCPSMIHATGSRPRPSLDATGS